MIAKELGYDLLNPSDPKLHQRPITKSLHQHHKLEAQQIKAGQRDARKTCILVHMEPLPACLVSSPWSKLRLCNWPEKPCCENWPNRWKTHLLTASHQTFLMSETCLVMSTTTSNCCLALLCLSHTLMGVHENTEWGGRHSLISTSQQAEYDPHLGHGMGKPQVYFLIPLPTPVNTVPAWVRVQFYCRFQQVTHGYSQVSVWICI